MDPPDSVLRQRCPSPSCFLFPSPSSMLPFALLFHCITYLTSQVSPYTWDIILQVPVYSGTHSSSSEAKDFYLERWLTEHTRGWASGEQGPCSDISVLRQCLVIERCVPQLLIARLTGMSNASCVLMKQSMEILLWGLLILRFHLTTLPCGSDTHHWDSQCLARRPEILYNWPGMCSGHQQ